MFIMKRIPIKNAEGDNNFKLTINILDQNMNYITKLVWPRFELNVFEK